MRLDVEYSIKIYKKHLKERPEGCKKYHICICPYCKKARKVLGVEE
jgi:hypothetical protein